MISYYLPFYLFKNARFYGGRFDPDQNYKRVVLAFTRSVAVNISARQQGSRQLPSTFGLKGEHGFAINLNCKY